LAEAVTKMTPDAWKRIKEIVADASEVEIDERQAFLDQRCPADLRSQVDDLLRSENTNAERLEAEAVSFSSIANINRVNERIGAYRIAGELGTGGMGTVYLAERADGEFEQKVALKLIKRGMDSEAILRRFINERQILASLRHPNIAHLIDGGTTDDGLPYFVLEHVEGETVTEYADRHDLGLEERLELFREVCSAVSYAHSNLVIHRDLKPSNILVTGDGHAKLLDFGIAKLLKSDTEGDTATYNFAFTPEYASPEQVRGEKLTTASDIYSLGVVLYELLTGTRLYKTEGKSLGEMIEAVTNTEVRPPSSALSNGQIVAGNWKTKESADEGERHTKEGQPETNAHHTIRSSQLKGDLDNITLKALRKEAEARYSSVEQFSEDIRRHLVGLPVTATSDTWKYRAAKFARRNRTGLAAAGLVLIALLTGLGATLYQANVAQREREKAEQRFNDVRALANSFLFEFHDAIQPLSGSTPARKLVVSRAIEYLDKLAVESNDDPALQRELGTAYERIGKIQGNSYFANLGDTDGAMNSYRRSLEIRQRLAEMNPDDRELQYDAAISHRGVGDMFYTMDDLQSALKSYETSLATLEKVAAEEPENLKYLSSLADILSRLGDIKGMVGYANLGDTAGALESYQRVVTLAEQLTQAVPDNQEYRGDLATRLFYFARLQASTGDQKGALISGRRSIELLEGLVAANPDHAAYETRLMASLNSMRPTLLAAGEFTEAITNARRVVKTLERLSADDPQNSNVRRSLGVSYNSLGTCLVQAKDTDEAIQYFRRSLSIAEALAAAEPKNVEHGKDVEIAKKSLAEAQKNPR